MKRIGISVILASLVMSLANAKSELKDIIENMSVDGFATIRYTANFGDDANVGGNTGKGWNPRLILNVYSGVWNGFSAAAGLVYNKGSGSTGNGTETDKGIWGSRGDANFVDGTDVFGFGNIYTQYANDLIQTTFRVGQMTLQTPINNKNFDRGLGFLIKNTSMKSVTISAMAFDTWITDGLYLRSFKDGLKGVGNDLFGLSFIGNKKELGNIDFQLWGFHASKLINYLIFAEVGYTINVNEDSNLNFELQVLNTRVNKSPSYSLSSGTKVSANTSALSRGLYTAQISGKFFNDLSSKIGYIGSFGSGYGVSLDNMGEINKGGKYWYDTSGSQHNGFAWFGQGGKKDSSISVIYANIAYKIAGVGIALDIANIGGKNFYRGMYDGKGSNGFNGNKHAKFTEITPSISYNFVKNAQISTYYAMNFGDIKAQRIRAEIKYSF